VSQGFRHNYFERWNLATETVQFNSNPIGSRRQSATFSVDSALSFLVACRTSKCLYCAAKRESPCSTRNPATPLLY
jgi:hypothetical protein